MRRVMRPIAQLIVAGALSACATTAFAQASSGNPYGLDPYNPSDAWWLRNYGAVLVSQTPLQDLTKLDPYKPSDAALIRQLGGAQPAWYGASWPVSLDPSATAGPRHRSRSVNVVAVRPPAPPASGTAAPGPASPATPMRSAMQPATNDGVSIRFEGATWIAAGRAVTLQTADLERAGEYAGGPVYRSRADRNVIYVPTRDGFVAPFKRKQ